MSWLSNDVVSGLEKALDRTVLRQKAISQNIANVDTPGYKAKRVVFKDELDRRLQAYRTNPRHFQFSTSSAGGAYIREETDTAFNNNGNNVDMDREMAALAKNQIQYYALVAKLNGTFRRLDYVLRGGK
ncbi:MAG TPA: flagellar basal body rod protein FlgB [Bacillales bacterium]|nr:flagellar basal body rod protein FlgB [Bacillales bacterium]